MKKVWWLVLLLVLISACQQTGTEGQQSVNPQFRTGSQGFQMTFLQNQPPSRVYDTEELGIMIELRNLGASSLGGPGDRIYFSGFDPQVITNLPSGGFAIPKIDGKTATNLNPAPDIVTAKGIINPLNIESYPFRLLATACYSYETIAEAPLCVDPDPYEFRAEQKVCKPQTISLGTQGAPVSVSKVDIDARKNGMTLAIHINNVGGGQVFRFGAGPLSKCSPYVRPGLQPSEIDYVMVQDVTVGRISLKPNCRSLDEGHVRLSSNSGTIVCNMDTSSFASSAVVTPLKITLKYGYRNTLFQNVEIVRTPR